MLKTMILVKKMELITQDNIYVNVKNAFENAEINAYQRVNAKYILDLYLGRDASARETLLLLCSMKPEKICSSKIIDVAIGLRQDKKWSVSFSLSDKQYIDMFCLFCQDIIESTRFVSNADRGAIFVCNRYLRWQEMLKKKTQGLLSYMEIKGLTGELYFLKEYMIPEFGFELALNSWTGPEGTKQDFEIGNTWYEVKSTTSGATSIKISSTEQLDTSDPGELVVMYLDKTSPADQAGITLNSLYAWFMQELPTDEQRCKISNLLFSQGYVHHREYDDYIFHFHGMERYFVDNNFPCLRKNILPDSIGNVTYELTLSSIKSYLKEN